MIIFCKAKHSELVSLKKCLEKYCSWSGQLISIEKSGVFPSRGVSINFLRQVKCCWGLNPLLQSTTYVGVPLFLSKNRSNDLKLVKERLESKLSSWKGRNLSWAGRATLIKFMAQSIPTYTMATLQFPRKLCDQLDSVIRRFWWNPKTEPGHFWTPIAWSALCRSQKDGSLGFRNSWDFNQAMLSKLAWWILSGKNCLCVNVLKAKYKVRQNWLNHCFLGNASPV